MKLSELPVNTDPSTEDLVYVVDDPEGTPQSRGTPVSAILNLQNINDLLPTQTSNSGKFLQTNGSNVSWVNLVPTAGENSGELLYNNSGVITGATGLTYDGLGGIHIDSANSQLILTSTFTSDPAQNVRVYSNLTGGNATLSMWASNGSNEANLDLAYDGFYLTIPPESSVWLNNNRIRNVATPVASADAVNKSYVDGRLTTANTWTQLQTFSTAATSGDVVNLTVPAGYDDFPFNIKVAGGGAAIDFNVWAATTAADRGSILHFRDGNANQFKANIGWRAYYDVYFDNPTLTVPNHFLVDESMGCTSQVVVAYNDDKYANAQQNTPSIRMGNDGNDVSVLPADTATLQVRDYTGGDARFKFFSESGTAIWVGNGTVEAAAPASGAGNSLTLKASAGIGSNNNGGNVIIQAGAKSGSGADGSVIVKAITSSPNNLLEWQDSSSNVLSTISENGYFTTRKIAAPADSELSANEVALWFDSTNGAAKLKIKGKSANGTVVAGEVALA